MGKVRSVFTGSGTQHSGQESTVLTMVPSMLQHGMVVVERLLGRCVSEGVVRSKRPEPFAAVIC